VVSSDFVGSRHACIFDSEATIVNGKSAILYCWYDNESYFGVGKRAISGGVTLLGGGPGQRFCVRIAVLTVSSQLRSIYKKASSVSACRRSAKGFL